MPNEVKLLPCPFCGREPISTDHGALVFHQIAPCPLSKQHFDVRIWNTRPTTVVAGERQSVGASANADQALAVPVEPVARLDPTGFDPSRRALTALAQLVMELRLSERVFRQYGLQHLDKAEEAREDPREFNSRMQKAYRNTARADCCKLALDLFEANGGIDAYAAIATEARRAETPKSGSVHEGAGPQDIAQ